MRTEGACLLLLLLAILYSVASSSPIIRTVPLRYPALYPESIAWDDRLRVFFSGSFVHGAVFAISDSGSVREYIRDPDYAGRASTLGIALDARRRRLLVVVNNLRDLPDSFNGLAAYHADTKHRIFLAPLAEGSMPNDVSVDDLGNAYVSDAGRNVVYLVTLAGDVSVFVDSLLFKNQAVVTKYEAAQGCGLNGIAVSSQSKYLLVVQANSGKLFKVQLESNDREVSIVDVEKPLVEADGLAFKQDGMLVVVSAHTVWTLKSRDHWQSAYVVDETELDSAGNATTVALRGPKDEAFVVHAHFQDVLIWLGKGLEGLPGMDWRSEFSLQEIQLPDDPDNNPLWLLVIVVAVLVLVGAYKLQMTFLVNKYHRRMKLD